jgi:uncharacterized protein YjbI with pentapeptide repeats
LADNKVRPLSLLEIDRLKRYKLELLRAHHDWVETNGAAGMQLDLSGKDLRQVMLRGAYLDEANLLGARLWRAKLDQTDQRGAHQKEVVLGEKPPEAWY